MGFIHNAGDSVREVKEITRWVEIIEQDDVLGLPPVAFEMSHVNEAALLRLSKPFANRKADAPIDLNKERKFRANFTTACVKNWRGVSNANLRRLSDVFLANPEVFEGDPDDQTEWVFDKSALGFIAENISSEKFGIIANEATNLQEFVRVQLEREKKD